MLDHPSVATPCSPQLDKGVDPRKERAKGDLVEADWAEGYHYVYLTDDDGARPGFAPLPEGVKRIGGLHEMVAAHATEPAEVVVGIETDPGLHLGRCPRRGGPSGVRDQSQGGVPVGGTGTTWEQPNQTTRRAGLAAVLRLPLGPAAPCSWPARWIRVFRSPSSRRSRSPGRYSPAWPAPSAPRWNCARCNDHGIPGRVPTPSVSRLLLRYTRQQCCHLPVVVLWDVAGIIAGSRRRPRLP